MTTRNTKVTANTESLIAADDQSPDRLPEAGAGSTELFRLTDEWWATAAGRAGVDLSGFDPQAPLAERIAWTESRGLEIATVLSRFSSKLQHSTRSQVHDYVEYAAYHTGCTCRRSTSASTRRAPAARCGATVSGAAS